MSRFIFVICMAMSTCVHAQIDFHGRNGNPAQAQALFAEYLAQRQRPFYPVREQLERISASRLPQSRSNVEELARLITIASDDEKVILARLIAEQSDLRDAHRRNAAIDAALRPLIGSRNKAVAVSAMFSYSRQGYRPDTITLLQSAVTRGALDNSTYLGELAHLFPYAPPDKQILIIGEIDRGDGGYAREILASGTGDMSGRLSPATRAALHAMLIRHEPVFSTAIGEFGMSEAFAYEAWLHTIACLQAQCATAAYDAIILARLNEGNTSAKKILAFLSSNNGPPFLRRMGKRPTADLLRKVEAYRDGLPLPPNSVVLDLANGIKRKYEALPN